jgi:hypothetical protein
MAAAQAEKELEKEKNVEAAQEEEEEQASTVCNTFPHIFCESEAHRRGATLLDLISLSCQVVSEYLLMSVLFPRVLSLLAIAVPSSG